uniref:Uncharacterized protein n=1 Tax=Vitis vinifera TaxID=29760 RepID=A5AHK8_VITVI|nr:hypothetical protein VITISV_041964 [Vitis vinifera]
MEIPHEDQSSHYDHEKDKFAYLSMRDQIELGKRQVQQSQWGRTNAKRSRKVLKIDTLVGDCYDNSMDQPSIENHKVQDDKGLPEPFKASTSLGKRRETNSLGPNGKDANFVWDPGGIQHEVGVYDACKNRSYDERKGRKERILAIGSIATLGHILEHFLESILYILYTFSKLGKKLDRAEREFRTPQSKVRKSQFKVHQFRTPLFKVRKFSHRAKPPPGTRVPFRTPQANFRTVRNKVRKFRTVRN